MTSLQLQNRVAVVTGGSRGIGKEIALTFAREGCKIVLVARHEKELEEAALLIRETGADVRTFAVDINNVAGLNAMATDITTAWGRIDILINAAAIVGPIGPVEDADTKGWEQTMSINVMGTYNACQAVLPTMISQKEGVIINFAGGGAFGARERFGAYSVSKAAVVRLTDVLALELKDKGITVNAISPGQVNTQMFDTMVAAGPEKVGAKGWAEFQKRLETGGDSPEAAGQLALFLVSSEGRRITGRSISVQWDPWKHFPQYAEELAASDIYTMRRIKPDDYGKQWS